MNNLEKEIISFTYDIEDCKKGIDWIKQDAILEIEKQLNSLITYKPIQATFTLVYTANLNGSENDYDIKG